MKTRYTLLFYSSIMLLLLATAHAGATPYTFTASSGYHSVSATFSVEERNLYVTLSNDSQSDAMGPTDILTAIFFNMDAVLTPSEAKVTENSTVNSMNGDGTYTEIGGSDVRGEWAYKADVSKAPGGGTKGISSAGFSIFGPSDLFNKAGNLFGPDSPNGLDYGIAPKGDNPATGNGDVLGTPLIRHAVKFLFTGDFIVTDPRYAITNLEFIFGTATDVHLAPPPETVPEPSTMSLLLLGCAAAGFCIYRRRTSKA